MYCSDLMSHLQGALHISIVFYTVFVSSWIVRLYCTIHGLYKPDSKNKYTHSLSLMSYA